MMEYDDDRKLARRIRRLRRHARWILAGTALGGLAALVISLLLPKTYRATTYLLVSTPKVEKEVQNSTGAVLVFSNPDWNYGLLKTFFPLIDSDETVQRAITEFHLDQPPYRLTAQQFRRGGYLDVDIPKASRLLEITVEFPDPALAARLANYLADAAVKVNNEMDAADTAKAQAFYKQRLEAATADLAEAESRRLPVVERGRIEDQGKKDASIPLGRKEPISGEMAKLRLTLAREAFEAASRDYRNASVTVSAKTLDLKQLAPALPPDRPVRPRPVFNTLLGLLLSFTLLTGTALTLESLREMQPETSGFIPEDEPVDVRQS